MTDKLREALQLVLGHYGDDPRVDPLRALLSEPAQGAEPVALTFARFRAANVARCIKWHPEGINSWSPSDWLTAVTGELGELASLLKMRNRERDGLPGNKFSPTDKQVADELADVLTYLDLLAAVLGVDLGAAAVSKFNEVSERVGFPDRIDLTSAPAQVTEPVASLTDDQIDEIADRDECNPDDRGWGPKFSHRAFARAVLRAAAPAQVTEEQRETLKRLADEYADWVRCHVADHGNTGDEEGWPVYDATPEVARSRTALHAAIDSLGAQEQKP